MVRATAADAQIRAFAATTKNLVEEMRSLHNTSPVVSAALGRLRRRGPRQRRSGFTADQNKFGSLGHLSGLGWSL